MNAERIREILDDADNVAGGMWLAWKHEGLSDHAYAESLAATYGTALARISSIVEVGP